MYLLVKYSVGSVGCVGFVELKAVQCISLLIKYSVGFVGCVGFVELKVVECICLLSILLGLLGRLVRWVC